jgi:formate hydrogenlyase transcriptional activator
MKIADQGPDVASLWALIDSLPALIHTGRPDGYLDFFNRRWLEFVGLRLEDLEGWKWTAVVHPDDVAGLVARWRACLASGEPFGFEARVRRADGEYRWMLHQKVALRDESGEIAKWYGSSVEIEDRKRAEFKIRAQEAELRRVIDAIPTLAWCNLTDGSNEFLNKTWHEYTGLSPENSHGWGWQAAFHPEDLPPLMENWKAMLVSGEPGEIEARLRRHDGAYRWFLIRAEPFRDEAGKIVRWYGTSTDIEDRKQAEDELRRSEESLHEAQKLSHTGSWKYDLLTGAIVLTPEMARIFAEPSSYDGAWSTEYFFNRFHPEDRERVKSLFEVSVKQKTDFQAEYRIVLPDGRIRHLHTVGHPVTKDSGELAEFFGTTVDVTEHWQAKAELERALEEIKQSEEKLRQDERELRRIVDVVPQLLVVHDAEGTPIYANQNVLDYTGLTNDDMSRPDIFSLVIHPDDLERLLNLRQTALLRGLPFEIEIRGRRKDGQYRWFLNRYHPFRDEQGRVMRWYSIATDIEERKRTEERTRNENLALREQVDRDSMFEDIVGSSEALRKVLRQVSKVAPSDSTVLILGETGTGKELVARAIHKRSTRSERAFIGVNCAAIPPSLIASELFGHEKGAFTGATQRRVGRFESANGGTIFLDEVGDLPQDIQIALLRVLQEREIERVGSNRAIPMDVRVLAATHRDLDALVAEGKFREDLLYRLSVVPIQMPPLRERADDIPVLVDYFIARFGKKAGKKFRTIEKRTAELFEAYQWPGNVRELQNVIERAVILNEGDIFGVDETWLKRQPPRSAGPTVALSGALQRQAKEMIEAALAESGGRVAGPDGAAAKLGLPRPTLDARIKRLGIDKYRFKSQRPN